MYSIDDLDIEDTSLAVLDRERPVLERTLQLTVPSARQIWFRALTGDDLVEGDVPNVFKTEELQVSLPAGATLTRSFSDGGPAEHRDHVQEEVLLLFLLPSGTSTWRIEYELLR